ncbi:SCP-like extracellular protein [Devosia sp. LC5]|uniref:CAP domain-containing protein n=1 Tax=Devosia sp. LC5 TaxID=1502724 RepID=UPI0004E4178E|nr:CAP domain-containing protein [Devosia sp. LC5]KFC61789.1 SCP-like extracellular protein [Devosia sp. LC5]
MTHTATPRRFAGTLPHIAVALLTAAALAGCSMGGGGSTGIALAPGLSARMDQPGASLDRAQALGIVNAYRATNGIAPLAPDTGLDGTAQALANQYAQTGTPPKTPQGLRVMKLSAGYATFAETFSGWRNNPADAAGLTSAGSKAGVAMAFNPASSYGVYWVLVVGD